MICIFLASLELSPILANTLTPILQKPALVVSKMDLPERRNPWLINKKYYQQLIFVLSASVPLWCPSLHRAPCQAGSSSDWPCRPRWNQNTFKINLFVVIHHESLYPCLIGPHSHKVKFKFKLVLLLPLVPFPMLLIFLSLKQTWSFAHYLIFYQIFYSFGKRRLILASINLVLWWSPLMWQW